MVHNYKLALLSVSVDIKEIRIIFWGGSGGLKQRLNTEIQTREAFKKGVTGASSRDSVSPEQRR